MSKDPINKLYNGETLKTKELIYLYEELLVMSKLLCGMGDHVKPFFLEVTLRLEQVSDYLLVRDKRLPQIKTESSFHKSINIKTFIKDPKNSFTDEEFYGMIEHLENIQLYASKLGDRYYLLDKYIFEILEKINKNKYK